jgi:hypothetical protein
MYTSGTKQYRKAPSSLIETPIQIYLIPPHHPPQAIPLSDLLVDSACLVFLPESD